MKHRAAMAMLLFAVPVSSLGCSSWQPLEVGVASARPDLGDNAVRVTTRDGEDVIILDSEYRGDSIFGTTGERICMRAIGSEVARCRREIVPVRVSTANVVSIEERRFSLGRTFGIVLAIPAIVLTAATASYATR